MRQGRGGLLACALALALMLGATPVVLGLGPDGPPSEQGVSAVVADYGDDGMLGARHEVDALQSALADRRHDRDFAHAVLTRLDEMLLGARTSPAAAAAAPPGAAAPEPSGRRILERDPADALAGATSSGSGALALPEPSPGEDRPPWPFMALSALAALLVMTGFGSTVYRRVRRPPASGH